MTNKAKSLLRVASVVVLAGVPGFSAKASATHATHVTLEIEDALGPPSVQAQIVACIGEPVFFTGTVHVTLVDGEATHVNWGGVTGTTLDGDRFVVASATAFDTQSNLTLVEVGAATGKRQFHVQVVRGVMSVTCHN